MLPDNKTLDNFQLSTNLLTDLYKDSLVILDFPQNSTPMLNEKKSELLGGFQSNILLLVSVEGVPFLHDEDLQLLTKMLGACKLSLADVGILNLAQAHEKNWKSIIESYKAQKLIVFGEIHISDIPSIPKNHCSEFENLPWIHTLSLDELNRNPEEKKVLWNALKQLFNLNA